MFTISKKALQVFFGYWSESEGPVETWNQKAQEVFVIPGVQSLKKGRSSVKYW